MNVAFFMLCLLHCAVSSPRAKTCLRRFPSYHIPGSVNFCSWEGFNIWIYSPLMPLWDHTGSYLVQFSCSFVSDSLRPHGLQHARLPCPSPTPGAYSNSCPLSRWCHPTISSSVILPSPPAFNLSQHQGLFQWVISSNQVAKVLEFQLQQQSIQWIFRTDFL